MSDPYTPFDSPQGQGAPDSHPQQYPPADYTGGAPGYAQQYPHADYPGGAPGYVQGYQQPYAQQPYAQQYPRVDDASGVPGYAPGYQQPYAQPGYAQQYPQAGPAGGAPGYQQPYYAQPYPASQLPPLGAQSAYAGAYLPAPRSRIAAGLLGLFLGGLGIHNFYLGHTGRGLAQLGLMVLGCLLSVIFIGLFLVLAVLVWALVESILILSSTPGSVPWGVDARGVPLTD